MRLLSARVLATLLFLAFAGVSAPAARAFGLSLGATVGGVLWQPGFRDWMRGDTGVLMAGMKRFSINPSAATGPSVALHFGERVTWASQFTYSLHHAQSSYFSISLPTVTSLAPVRNAMAIHRFDVESRATIDLNRYVSFIVGGHYQRWDMTRNDVNPISSIIVISRTVIAYNGPGGGVGFEMRADLAKNLQLLAGYSFYYHYAIILHTIRSTFVMTTSVVPMTPNKLQTMYQGAYSPGASLALAYTVVPAATTITVGGRYQLLYYQGKNLAAQSNRLYLNGKYDHRFSLALTVFHTIDFAKKSTIAR